MRALKGITRSLSGRGAFGTWYTRQALLRGFFARSRASRCSWAVVVSRSGFAVIAVLAIWIRYDMPCAPSVRNRRLSSGLASGRGRSTPQGDSQSAILVVPGSAHPAAALLGELANGLLQSLPSTPVGANGGVCQL